MERVAATYLLLALPLALQEWSCTRRNAGSQTSLPAPARGTSRALARRRTPHGSCWASSPTPPSLPPAPSPTQNPKHNETSSQLKTMSFTLLVEEIGVRAHRLQIVPELGLPAIWASNCNAINFTHVARYGAPDPVLSG